MVQRIQVSWSVPGQFATVIYEFRNCTVTVAELLLLHLDLHSQGFLLESRAGVACKNLTLPIRTAGFFGADSILL